MDNGQGTLGLTYADASRKHDLPPRWDGMVVVWDGWYAPPPVFICPPPKRDCCSGCGSLETAVQNRGRVAWLADVTPEQIAADDAARARRPAGQGWRVKPKALYRLTAFRCPHCRLDTVSDITTGECWTLDDTDYGDDGST